jgi:very-short-patch-repair endonuclease
MIEYPYPYFDEKRKIICQICGKSFLVISPRHLDKHNIKYDEYKKRFPDAPLSTQEFKARGKYGKTKLFEDDELGPEQVVYEKEPDVEELNIESLIKDYKAMTPMEAMKARILDHLRLYFTNIRKDYSILQYGIDNRLKFEFITDFCDPVLKVVIQFPNTFWHNEEAGIDLNKNLKLSQYGWKVIEIPSTSPSFKMINKYLDEI